MKATIRWATPNADAEMWVPIPENENYLLSSSGRVFSKASGREIKTPSNAHGYPYIGTKSKGIRKNILVHRALMQLFGPPQPMGKNFVNHKDGDKTNNSLSNLEWCDHSENMRHSVNVLQNPKPPSHLGRIGAMSKLSKPVIATNIRTGDKLFFESMRRADAVGFRIANVRASIAGSVNHYKGFKWEKA